MKSIPVSKIDALIASLKAAERIDEFNYYNWNAVQDVILTLEDIKKESEKMIPLSTIVSLIDDALEMLHNSKHNVTNKVSFEGEIMHQEYIFCHCPKFKDINE